MSALSNILTGLKDLMEGTTGVAVNKITSRQFEYVSSPVEELKVRSSKRPRPFNILQPVLEGGSAELGDMTARTKMRGEHRLELKVAYPSMPHDELTLLGDIADDETTFRKVLEYEPNIALTSGWTGCSIVGSEVRDVEGEGGDAPPKSKLLVITLSVSHRDTRIS